MFSDEEVLRELIRILAARIQAGLGWGRFTGSWLKVNYGWTNLMYADLSLIQGSKCGICKEEINQYTVQLDHNHATGKPRGLLCKLCNVKVARVEKGNLKYDSPKIEFYRTHPPADKVSVRKQLIAPFNF